MSKDSSAKYYPKTKKQKTCERYQSLSKKKESKWQYSCEGNKNVPDDEKHKLVEKI